MQGLKSAILAIFQNGLAPHPNFPPNFQTLGHSCHKLHLRFTDALIYISVEPTVTQNCVASVTNEIY